jgi:hypothetical protein
MSRNRYRHKPSRCRDWPHCACSRRWQRYADFDIDANAPFTKEEIEAIHWEMVFFLSCVASYCPDADKRHHAQLQLCRPIFSREARRWIQ